MELGESTDGGESGLGGESVLGGESTGAGAGAGDCWGSVRGLTTGSAGEPTLSWLATEAGLSGEGGLAGEDGLSGDGGLSGEGGLSCEAGLSVDGALADDADSSAPSRSVSSTGSPTASSVRSSIGSTGCGSALTLTMPNAPAANAAVAALAPTVRQRVRCVIVFLQGRVLLGWTSRVGPASTPTVPVRPEPAVTAV
jgi:hypothetical protein